MASSKENNIEPALDPALAAAIAVLGGAVVPLNEGIRRLGLTINRRAIHARRQAGTLPVEPTQIGRNYFITAGAAAALFRAGSAVNAAPPPAPPPRRGPGRPRGTTTRGAGK